MAKLSEKVGIFFLPSYDKSIGLTQKKYKMALYEMCVRNTSDGPY